MRQNVLQILSKIRPEGNFEESVDYIRDGLLDSFDIVTLVSELEKDLTICIDGEEVTPENFMNLETITALVKRYLDKNEN